MIWYFDNVTKLVRTNAVIWALGHFGHDLLFLNAGNLLHFLCPHLYTYIIECSVLVELIARKQEQTMNKGENTVKVTVSLVHTM